MNDVFDVIFITPLIPSRPDSIPIISLPAIRAIKENLIIN